MTGSAKQSITSTKKKKARRVVLSRPEIEISLVRQAKQLAARLAGIIAGMLRSVIQDVAVQQRKSPWTWV
jgi:hypothetical protein